MPTTHHHSPASVHPPGPYTHGVVATGPLVLTAGQVALDAAGRIVGRGNLAAQTEQVFANLRAVLTACGTDLLHVVKLTVYVVDLQPVDRATIASILRRHLSTDRLPANTLVGVQALARPELLVEIEALAVMPRRQVCLR